MNHYTTEAEWRRWFAQQMAQRVTSAPVETRTLVRKYISGSETTKDAGKLSYSKPSSIQRIGRARPYASRRRGR